MRLVSNTTKPDLFEVMGRHRGAAGSKALLSSRVLSSRDVIGIADFLATLANKSREEQRSNWAWGCLKKG